tara:strand:- start:58 stop:1377 length:1320 start_codon:yes stop_codon:yes gene_type:complete
VSDIKKTLLNKLKSSPRFGDLFVKQNIQEVLKERRFLFFTKNGPIEIVFNLKHYLSALILSIIIIFKTFQFAFFGVINLVSYIMIQNNQTQVKQFTDSEVEALKELAETVIEDEVIEEIGIPNIEKLSNKDNETLDFFINVKNKINMFSKNIRDAFFFDETEISSLDESIFDDYANLSNPHMVPIEKTIDNRNSTKKVESGSKNILKNTYSYNILPVIPFAAPRNNKTKMIQFSKTIDFEIMDLVNVFLTLNLKPDNIDLSEINNFANSQIGQENDESIIDQISKRFQYLETLKEAIIFLPLKPPMEYYYVSSPYGMRIHPKTKKKQMHKGIDMAGTWQEEVRSASHGIVEFSGRHGSFGNVIKIKHKHGVQTVYGHLHKLMVKKGEYVQQGQIIGKMGATGRVAGAHLHYEIKVNNKQVNPYDFISVGRNLISSSILK